MGNTIDQQVINYLAGYYSVSSSSITTSTTFSSLGSITTEDMIGVVSYVEENFGLPFNNGDIKGIVTVADLIALIKSKLPIPPGE